MSLILGIDPGTNYLAWCLYDTTKACIVHCMVDRFSKKLDADARNAQVGDVWTQRMAGIYRCVNVVAIERMFSKGNASDAPLAVCAHYLRLACKRVGLVPIELSVGTVRKAVLGDGRGGAKKDAVQEWVRAHYPGAWDVSPDCCDALLVALAAAKGPAPTVKPRKRSVRVVRPSDGGDGGTVARPRSGSGRASSRKRESDAILSPVRD